MHSDEVKVYRYDSDLSNDFCSCNGDFDGDIVTGESESRSSSSGSSNALLLLPVEESIQAPTFGVRYLSLFHGRDTPFDFPLEWPSRDQN